MLTNREIHYQEQIKRLQQLVRKMAGWLGAITFVIAFITFHTVINSNGVSTNAAKCASIGGIYSNQDEQCYYNGKATTVEQIIDKK